MKINLFFTNGQKITFNKTKIEKEVFEFNKKLIKQKESNIAFEKNIEKDKINKISFLMKDLGYILNLKEIQNIINKKNPNNEIENIIINLYEVLDIFLTRNKPIHRGNLSMLFEMIDSDQKSFKDKSVFRTNNEVILFNKNFYIKTQDFNIISSTLDQFLEFINKTKEEEISPLMVMQIINIHSLLISPFNKYNLMLSKFLSMWYLNVFENEIFNMLPSNLYLDVIQKNEKKYKEMIRISFETADYTDFVLFLINKMNNYLDVDTLNKKVIKCLKIKYRKFLANNERKFIFLILLNKLEEFDWKLFKKTSQIKVSKQYILVNLSKLEYNYNLLKSKKYKNRKFFLMSQHFKNIIRNIQEEKKII